ncbi:MAG: sulfotransferase family 2 domain-containing protein [Ilumatobacteraceae bacterium]
MIYDPHLGLIFIKTLKVSGSSFEAAIAPLLSELAVVTINESWTSDGKSVDSIALRRTSWLPLRRLIPQILRHRTEARHIPSDILRSRGPRHEAFSIEKDHMSADDIRSQIGHAEWNRCTKVEIARNPYERIVSYYFMKRRQSSNPSTFLPFGEWLALNPEAIVKNERLVSVTQPDGTTRPDIDMVLYYEDMDQSLQTFATRFGLDAELLISRYRSTTIHSEYRPRDNSGRAESIIDARSKQLIDLLIARRFDRLGYRHEIENVIPINRTKPNTENTQSSRIAN